MLLMHSPPFQERNTFLNHRLEDFNNGKRLKKILLHGFRFNKLSVAIRSLVGTLAEAGQESEETVINRFCLAQSHIKKLLKVFLCYLFLP